MGRGTRNRLIAGIVQLIILCCTGVDFQLRRKRKSSLADWVAALSWMAGATEAMAVSRKAQHRCWSQQFIETYLTHPEHNSVRIPVSELEETGGVGMLCALFLKWKVGCKGQALGWVLSSGSNHKDQSWFKAVSTLCDIQRTSQFFSEYKNKKHLLASISLFHMENIRKEPEMTWLWSHTLVYQQNTMLILKEPFDWHVDQERWL